MSHAALGIGSFSAPYIPIAVSAQLCARLTMEALCRRRSNGKIRAVASAEEKTPSSKETSMLEIHWSTK